MTCDHRSRVLVALCALFCAMRTASAVKGARDFEQKVSILQQEEPEDLKCFAWSRKDFTCFWEEDEKTAGPVSEYSFTYTYKFEKSAVCPLMAQSVAGGKTRFTCHLKQIKMFVEMDADVHREGQRIHNRTLFIELLFVLDPPTNVTVSRLEKQGQLNVSWVGPYLRYMDDSMQYEIRYSAADSRAAQVEMTRARSDVILTDLEPGTKYKVDVRVRMEGLIYGGYWSVWSEAAFMETLPAEFDLLIVSLTLIIFFIFIVLSLAIIMSHRRFLTKKIWPVIPSPENKFQGLFTMYGGDFQEWLENTNGGLWVAPDFLYSEEYPSSLEVISDFSLRPPLVSPPLPAKASRASTLERKADEREKVMDEREMIDRGNPALTEAPNDHWLMGRLRTLHQSPMPCSQSSLLESQDTYVTLSNHNESEHLDDILEESMPLEVLFASRKTTQCESHSDLGSGQQSSGSGHLSSQSSFDYPNHAWAHKGPSYTYMAVADSGVSSLDYSSMSRSEDIGRVAAYANDYKNEIPATKRLLLQRQHALHHNI